MSTMSAPTETPIVPDVVREIASTAIVSSNQATTVFGNESLHHKEPVREETESQATSPPIVEMKEEEQQDVPPGKHTNSQVQLSGIPGESQVEPVGGDAQGLGKGMEQVHKDGSVSSDTESEVGVYLNTDGCVGASNSY